MSLGFRHKARAGGPCADLTKTNFSDQEEVRVEESQHVIHFQELVPGDYKEARLILAERVRPDQIEQLITL